MRISREIPDYTRKSKYKARGSGVNDHGLYILHHRLQKGFVPGVESWVSLSVMKTQEDIVGDTKLDYNGNVVEAGYIPRPTDQRVNFSMFFTIT